MDTYPARRVSRKKLTDIARWLYAADGADYCRSCSGLCAKAGNTCNRPELYADNRDTVQVFMNLNWEYTAMGQPTGIRVSEIQQIMWFLGIGETDKTRLFHGIRAMEREALKHLKTPTP